MLWNPILLSLKLALITTIILFAISIPLSYWLSKSSSKLKPILEAIIALPLVLPPTVLGFYLLLAFSPQSSLGTWVHSWFGMDLLFSFPGLVIGSCLYSLPFMVQPLQSGFLSIPKSLMEAARLMDKDFFTVLFRVLLPNMKSAVLSGLILTFAHTMGEFGVVLMIGGNIPNQTKVASIAIYDEVESLNYALANQYAMILVALSFVTLLVVYTFNGGYFKQQSR
ncbi:molybdenum ABC transporter permease subunit [Echinicola pacifica]|uniref:Molybdenum transport system permease n=1 Tax=Echinicola pacifica TaxID=346377 RepID=A0A918PMX0_9BACT|nr:molybdate ABC transporter permease subunit [Echinicola pacifica]GGZ16315.1 molybdenum ABC transporter permease subunit [Echinicola pacifica]